jgi:molybdopterin-guanine dinucleotide biosynthesis protein A
MKFSSNSFEIFILAGGKSQRMGTDKGLRVLCGKPMIAYLLDTLYLTLGSHFPIGIITQEKNYSQFNVPLLPDLIADKGPMGGLFTALTHSESAYVLLLSCDMPLVSTDILTALIQALPTAWSDCIIAQTPERIHPLLGIYHQRLREKVQDNIHHNHLKMMPFIRANHPHFLNMETIYRQCPQCFQNVNTPEAFAEMEAFLSLSY